jgi:hypothetical protein
VQRLRRLRASPCRAAFLDFRPSIANVRVVQLSMLRFRPVGQLDRLSGAWRIAATLAIHSGGVGHGGQSGTSVGTNCSRRGFASSFRWLRMGLVLLNGAGDVGFVAVRFGIREHSRKWRSQLVYVGSFDSPESLRQLSEIPVQAGMKPKVPKGYVQPKPRSRRVRPAQEPQVVHPPLRRSERIAKRGGR